MFCLVLKLRRTRPPISPARVRHRFCCELSGYVLSLRTNYDRLLIGESAIGTLSEDESKAAELGLGDCGDNQSFLARRHLVTSHRLSPNRNSLL